MPEEKPIDLEGIGNLLINFFKESDGYFEKWEYDENFWTIDGIDYSLKALAQQIEEIIQSTYLLGKEAGKREGEKTCYICNECGYKENVSGIYN